MRILSMLIKKDIKAWYPLLSDGGDRTYGDGIAKAATLFAEQH